MFGRTKTPKRTIRDEIETTEHYIDMLEAKMVLNAVNRPAARMDLSMLRTTLNELFVLQCQYNAEGRTDLTVSNRIDGRS